MLRAVGSVSVIWETNPDAMSGQPNHVIPTRQHSSLSLSELGKRVYAVSGRDLTVVSPEEHTELSREG